MASELLFFPKATFPSDRYTEISTSEEAVAARKTRGDRPCGTDHAVGDHYYYWFCATMAPAIERVTKQKIVKRWVKLDSKSYHHCDLVPNEPPPKRTDEKPKITFVAPVRGASGVHEDFRRFCEDVLAHYTDRDITVEFPSSSVFCAEIVDLGVLRIVFNAGAIAEYMQSPPAALEGISLPSRNYWMKSSGRGTAVKVGTHCVAEVFGEHTILVHYDPLSGDIPTAGALIQIALEAACRVLKPDADEKVQQLLKARDRARFGQMASASLTRRNKAIETDIKRLEGEIQALNDQLFAKMRTVRGKQVELTALTRPENELIEFGGKEYDRLTEHPLIERLNAFGSTITVDTKAIIIPDERTGKRHEVGRFRLTFTLGSDTVRWSFANLDRTIQSAKWPSKLLHHPHVLGTDAKPCLGNIEEALPQLLARNEFAQAIYLSLDFLSVADVYEVGTGSELNLFPEVPEPKQEEPVEGTPSSTEQPAEQLVAVAAE